MNTPRILFFILLSLIGIPSIGQDLARVDSLVTLLSMEKPDTTRCRIMFEIASAVRFTDTVKARDYLESAKRIAVDLNDIKALGRYYQILGKLNSDHGRYSEAILDYDRALAHFSEAGDQIAYYETVKDKGNVYLFMSDYPQALSHYNSALDFYRRNDMVMGISRCLNNIGIIHKNRGEYGEALSVYEESVFYLDTIRDALDICQAYINMGNVFVFLGSYERALEYFEEAREIAEREDFRKNISLCLSNSGVVQNKCNNYEEALNLYQRALSVSESIDDPVQISNCLINIGTNYADMGEPETGLSYVQEGLEMKLELGDERTISNCYIHLAEIHTMLEEFDRAIELLRTAIPVKEALGDQEGLVRSYLGLGSVNLQKESYPEAGRMTDHALEIAMNINALEHVITGFGIKRDIAVRTGDYRSAYQFAMQHHQFSDSLMNEATSRAAIEIEFRYRSRALEQENENLRVQTELTTELMRKRNAFLYSIMGIAFLLAAGLALVAYFLSRLRNTSLKLEEQNLVIIKQNLKLDNLNKTKDRMMSIIAHDLRGTIGNQLTAIEVLHRIEGEEEKEFDSKKLLGNLKHSSSYSLELLENLLHWSRLQGNESFYHPEEVKLEILVSNCIALFDETAGNKKLTIRNEAGGPILVRVDRIMMETIIRNLISNAIKFSNPGGNITVSAGKEGENVFFRVTDNGIGMNPELVRRVLSDNGGFTTRGTADEKGAGIGLTLVREFTAIHRGELKIDSTPGKGSSFEVIFRSIN